MGLEETEPTAFSTNKGGYLMNRKVFAALAAVMMLLVCMAAPVSAAEAEPKYQMGDVNMDGRVDLTDSMQALAYYCECISFLESSLTPQQLVLGNVDGKTDLIWKDESKPALVGLSDAMLILDYYTESLVSEDIQLSEITGVSLTFEEAWKNALEIYPEWADYEFES